MLVMGSAILGLPYLPFRTLRRALLLTSSGALVACVLSVLGSCLAYQVAPLLL